jgi:hypothetical protein
MADNRIRYRNMVSIGKMLGRYWCNVDNQSFGRLAGCKHKAGAGFPSVFAPRIRFMPPEVTVVDYITRNRLSP